MRLARLLALLCVGFAMSAPVAAQSYPARAVTIVVPFATGGGADLLARLLAEKLRESFKAGVVVENRPGATGQIATRHVIQSPADGYTVLLGTTSLINNPFLFASLPYDAMKQLRPVVSVADLSIFLAVPATSAANNVREFVDLAKRRSGSMNFASAGAGTTLHLASEWLKTTVGFEATHVPYKGSGEAVVALAGGQVDFNMDNLGPLQPLIASKRVRVLGVAAPRRNPALPDVPTLGESGLPDVNLATWAFLMVPTATPDDAVATLNAAVNRVIALADVRERLLSMGFVTTGGSVAEMAARMNQEAALWGPVIRNAKVTVN